MSWDLGAAIAFLKGAEDAARKLGLHVGLTGSVLYGGGTGKDLDVLVYRHDNTPTAPDDLHQLSRALNLGTDWARIDLEEHYPRYVLVRSVGGKRVDLVGV